MSNAATNKNKRKPKNSYSILLEGCKNVEKNAIKSSNNAKIQKKVLNEMDPDIPDRSYGDYYCKQCDSHMNSDNMWEAHITGKRHLRNVIKGDSESKYEELPDMESSIKHELRNVKDPIIGLSYIHEIRRKEANVPPIYSCYLCHASIATVPLLTEHIISLKHRLNYIKENNPSEYSLLQATNLKKGHMEPLVEESARKMEQEYGRGTVKVKREKKKDPVFTYSGKKSFNNQDDSFKSTFHNTYKSSKNDNDESVWKTVGNGNSSGTRERSRSPRDFNDRFMSPPRSRSPRDFRERKRYSDEDLIDTKKSFRQRSISPLRRQHSSKYDYDSFRSDAKYSCPSSEHYSCDRTDYVSSRYEHTNQQQSAKESFHSHERQQLPSSMLQDDYASTERSVIDCPIQPRSPISNHPKSFHSILCDTFVLTNEECYKLFYQRLKTLPQDKNHTEIFYLMKFIIEAQKRLKCRLHDEIIEALMQKVNTSSINIPGLSEVMSSSPKALNITASNSPNPRINAASFLSNLFKTDNSALDEISTSQPYSLPTSYAEAMRNISPTSYLAPNANSYQDASTGSYPNRTPQRHSNASASFVPSSVQNFPHNMPGRNPADKAPAQDNIFNYSHYSYTSSSASKNFYHHY